MARALDRPMDRTAAAARLWDAIVVGAGPAGSLLARELARGGAEVLLVDRSTFPRDKVCGACLSARSLGFLTTAGLGDLPAEAGAEPIGSLELVTAAGRATVGLPLGAALSRGRLDEALATAAQAAGAHFLAGSRGLLGPAGSDRREVRLPETGETLAARLVVAADGLGGGFVPEGALPRRVSRGSRLGAWAMLAPAPGATPGPGAGAISMAVSAEGYVGSVRVEGGAINVAAALDPRRVREHGLGGAVERILEQSAASSPSVAAVRKANWRGTAPLTRRPVDVALERVFLIGDSAGYVEPFTGEGMAWAFETALALAPLALCAVGGWSPALADAWRRSHGRGVARRQRWCRWVAVGLRHPRLVRLAVRALAARPRLAAPLVRRLTAPGRSRLGGTNRQQAAGVRP
jgi:flavin-dependent dehydrogenase